MSAIRCDLSVPASFNTVHPSWLWDSKQSQYLLWIQRANICFQSTKFKREVKANMLQVWQSDWNHLTRICFSKNSKKTKQKLVLIHQNAKWGPVSENRESCLGVSIHLHWSYSYELIQTQYKCCFYSKLESFKGFKDRILPTDRYYFSVYLILETLTLKILQNLINK